MLTEKDVHAIVKVEYDITHMRLVLYTGRREEECRMSNLSKFRLHVKYYIRVHVELLYHGENDILPVYMYVCIVCTKDPQMENVYPTS